MHFQINRSLLISTVLLLVLIQWHTTQADDHCNDKKRGFILDSCADLSKIRRQPQSPSSYERNKRENNEVIYEDDEPNFNLQTLPHNDTFLSYPILYYVWKRDFPTGMRLIMTKYNARQLQRFDRSYRMEERVVNRTGIENNETNDIEHKRIVKRDVHHKIGACCEYDAQCVAMMCFARN